MYCVLCLLCSRLAQLKSTCRTSLITVFRTYVTVRYVTARHELPPSRASARPRARAFVHLCVRACLLCLLGPMCCACGGLSRGPILLNLNRPLLVLFLFWILIFLFLFRAHLSLSLPLSLSARSLPSLCMHRPFVLCCAELCPILSARVHSASQMKELQHGERNSPIRSA